MRNLNRMTARLSTVASPLVQLERSMESGGASSAGWTTGRQSNGKLPGLDNPADLLPPITATCEVDILAKTEFHKICELLHAFNFYLQHEQTRIVLCIDAFEYACPVKLAALFYQVHSLILSQPTAPVAFVIATNIKVGFVS
ncbi:unnamed protein product [Dibothriocephalus latus]|uniref:Uncharacterized protein n=1 Tax=Dibothriocephalus latus TaxID=60516 RepID=A0A3P7LEH7_DIBLA|nr:unnamed protein product [Dibothriocephalus latus]